MRFFCCVFYNKKDNVMMLMEGKRVEVTAHLRLRMRLVVVVVVRRLAWRINLVGTLMPMVPLQKPDELQIPNPSWMQTSPVYKDMNIEHGIPTMITWRYGGKEVAVEGSWNDWKTRESLQRSALDELLDFLLQVTAFVALIAFDFLRADDNRIDCFPCFKVSNSNADQDKCVHLQNPGLLARYMKRRHEGHVCKRDELLRLLFDAVTIDTYPV